MTYVNAICGWQYPEEVIKNNAFRDHRWLASHLRTWRKELLLKVDVSEFKRADGEWLDTTGDQAIMFPMLELSGHRSRHIAEVNYVYNVANATRDGASNEARQTELSNYLRSKKRHQQLESL